MLSTGAWERSQQNLITFVLIDATGTEVAGLGAAFVLNIGKAGGAFAASAGVKAEMSNGWYSYLATAAEADTVGPVSIYITGAGIIQQNLEYVVETRTVTSVEFTYTVTNVVTGLPIEGVQCWFSTDVAGNNVVWNGTTDAFGVVRDENNRLPRLDPGTYAVFRQKVSFTFVDPDLEVVGP